MSKWDYEDIIRGELCHRKNDLSKIADYPVISKENSLYIKEKKMNCKKFIKDLQEESKKDYGLCPPPIEAQKGLNVLINHFLGDDWYVTLSMPAEQVNTEAIYQILEHFPRKKR